MTAQPVARATGSRPGARSIADRRRRRLAAPICFLLALSSCSVLPRPRVDPSGKVHTQPAITDHHPLVQAVANGALIGGSLGFAVSAVMCWWDGLSDARGTGSLGDPEDDGCGIPFTTFLTPPLVGAAGGAVVGLVGGLVIWMFEGLPPTVEKPAMRPLGVPGSAAPVPGSARD